MDEIFVDPRFGTFEYESEIEVWVGECALPAFQACGWNLDHVEAHLSPRYDGKRRQIRPPVGVPFAPKASAPAEFAWPPLKVEIEAAFDEDTEQAPVPTSAQLAALQDVVEHQEVLLRTIVAAFQARYGGKPHDHEKSMLKGYFPKLEALLKGADGVRSLIHFKTMRISNLAFVKETMVGFRGDDAFDEEHGIGVATRNRDVVKVGGSTTGWQF